MLITALQVHGRWVSGAEVDQPFSLSLIESKTAQFGDNQLTRESQLPTVVVVLHVVTLSPSSSLLSPQTKIVVAFKSTTAAHYSKGKYSTITYCVQSDYHSDTTHLC